MTMSRRSCLTCATIQRNNAADTTTNTTDDNNWDVSKIGNHEDIGDLQEGTLQTLRPFDNAHVPAMAIVDNQIDHFVISAFNTIFTEHEIRRS